MVLGGALFLFGLGQGGVAASYALAGGIAGTLLGALYLLSPAWRTEVLVHDHGLEVLSRGDRRFLLPWEQVVKLVVSPSTRTCFVDGGAPDRSLLVPGPGASAPYDIENKAALYDELVARVPADRRREVETLEKAQPDGETTEPGPRSEP